MRDALGILNRKMYRTIFNIPRWIFFLQITVRALGGTLRDIIAKKRAATKKYNFLILIYGYKLNYNFLYFSFYGFRVFPYFENICKWHIINIKLAFLNFNCYT